jgi:DNA-binding XRE family transcriptional regulator
MTHRQTMSPKQHILAINGFESGLQALFGTRLQEARRQTDPTQTALAASARLTRHYVTKIERAPISAALATIVAVTRIQTVAVGGMLQLQVPQKNSVKPNHPSCAAGMHIVYSVCLPGDDPGKFVGGKHGGTGQAIALRRAGATHY